MQEVGLTASEVYPEMAFPFKEILNNLPEFKLYLQNLKETLFVLKQRPDAHIYLTETTRLEKFYKPLVRGEGHILAILRINFENDDMEIAAEDTQRALLRAEGDGRESALLLKPGLYNVDYGSHFLIVM